MIKLCNQGEIAVKTLGHVYIPLCPHEMPAEGKSALSWELGDPGSATLGLKQSALLRGLDLAGIQQLSSFDIQLDFMMNG